MIRMYARPEERKNARATERKPEDEVSDVVSFSLSVNVYCVFHRVAVKLETLFCLAKGLYDGYRLVERPVPRETRLDLCEDAQPVESRRLEVLDSDVLQRWFVIAAICSCKDEVGRKRKTRLTDKFRRKGYLRFDWVCAGPGLTSLRFCIQIKIKAKDWVDEVGDEERWWADRLHNKLRRAVQDGHQTQLDA